MITGSLSQLYLYRNIHPSLEKAIDHVLQLDLAALETGHYETAAKDFYYMVNEYSTKPAGECAPERHRTYTDIQIMISGSEKFGYTPYTQQNPSTGFQPDNDVAFYTIVREEIDYITMDPGKFIIFFPFDIHQPEVCVDEPSMVKKLVVKVNMS